MRRLCPAVFLTAVLAGPSDSAFASENQAAAAPQSSRSAAFDPWEKGNRRVYAFNRGFDRVFFRPVARGYERVTPSLLRKGIRNFFDNLQQPVAALNLLLQGHPIKASAALGRFGLNSTFGIGGIFRASDSTPLPEYSADFGQTFSQWGWRKSRYVVLPIFGPSTLRDTLGKGVHSRVSPVDWLAREKGAGFSVLYGIDARARALSAEAFLADAADEYSLVRDGYLQYRKCQIVDCSTELPEYLAPDYDFEIPDFDAIRTE